MNTYHTSRTLNDNQKKYVSIHSEDRDMLKHPNSSHFAIDIPNTISNVKTVRLTDWTFPSNYNTFSKTLKNTTIKFKINIPFNPVNSSIYNHLFEDMYIALYYNKKYEYMVEISEGFYSPQQMSNELTNRFNRVINDKIIEFIEQKQDDPEFNGFHFKKTLELLKSNKAKYQDFVFTFNEVKQKMFIGNQKDGFIMTNSSQFDSINMLDKTKLDFYNWGLPAHLGLNMFDDNATTQTNELPRFYHMEGDDGYWLSSYGDDVKVFWIEPREKINLFGPAYFYLECAELNCIDETLPFVMNDYTMTNNTTNGRVRSALAKIPIPSTPLSQYFDSNSTYCVSVNNHQQINKLHFKLRYHNGEIVNFGRFEYSFTLEFDCF